MSEANPDVGGGTPIRRIVVGVDGSEPSIRALQWAARQAEWSGATLEVLTAWTFPEHPAPLGHRASCALARGAIGRGAGQA